LYSSSSCSLSNLSSGALCGLTSVLTPFGMLFLNEQQNPTETEDV
jgi:hypothetical protein